MCAERAEGDGRVDGARLHNANRKVVRWHMWATTSIERFIETSGGGGARGQIQGWHLQRGKRARGTLGV
jgi:hypothetical protein